MSKIIGFFLVYFFMLLPLTACYPPSKWGTDKQGAEARARLEGIETWSVEKLSVLQNALRRYSSHEGVKILIDQLIFSTDPSLLPAPTVKREQLSPHMGVFQETEPGVFELVTITSSHIAVTYLDGSSLSISMEFKGTPGDELAGFMMGGAVGRLYYDNNINAGNERLGFATTGLVEGIRVSGSLLFRDDSGSQSGVAILYYLGTRLMDPCDKAYITPRAYGVFCDPSYDALEHIRGFYVQFNGPSTVVGENWHELGDATLFRQSTQQGVWLARQNYKTISNHFDIQYDSNVQVNNPLALLTPGSTAYHSYGRVYTVESGRIVEIFDVAKFLASDYECDLSNPSLPGSGTEMKLRWSDDVIETLFPTPELNCSDLVWRQW